MKNIRRSLTAERRANIGKERGEEEEREREREEEREKMKKRKREKEAGALCLVLYKIQFFSFLLGFLGYWFRGQRYIFALMTTQP